MIRIKGSLTKLLSFGLVLTNTCDALATETSSVLGLLFESWLDPWSGEMVAIFFWRWAWRTSYLLPIISRASRRSSFSFLKRSNSILRTSTWKKHIIKSISGERCFLEIWSAHILWTESDAKNHHSWSIFLNWSSDLVLDLPSVHKNKEKK